ncbi:uncharacterized protein BX664DRAFT_323334 [Halteromyces radiatus]|uniref:uncharacterized protein n=1 Tax=Halteromyces radiatus TaxID=101107 RepID=UPI0022206D91|nr:uncharacterized protein BX664DRAFT_323334 [Halteromyces radiatus]KAI8096188.1 hypothetical protein BX664DRAFT_323334 [Halteromyces radiatus]
MDFVSAPLQSLLFKNADSKQLQSYLEQLYTQFGNSVDEKDRFGTLQIMLPVLRAHLDQATNKRDIERCLTTILRPLILSTLAHDSMVSTESVSLVAKSAAHFAVLSLTACYQQQINQDMGEHIEDTFDQTTGEEQVLDYGFGYQLLQTVIGQLVLVMDIEPDFVDLKPLEFISDTVQEQKTKKDLWNDIQEKVNKLKQTCHRQHKSRISMLQDDDDTDDNISNSSLYNGGGDNESAISSISFNTTMSMATKMTLSDFTTMGLLDLECCLDLMLRFVQEALFYYQQKHQENRDEDELLQSWVDLILDVTVAMLPCTNVAIRSKLVNDLLPALFCWKQWTLKDKASLSTICQMLWNRTLQIFGLPATNLLRSETYGLIAKYFDFYFGLDAISLKNDSPIVYLDLRFKDDFFMILQSGLRSDDSLARKYTSFILKRVIDFSKRYSKIIDNDTTNQHSWTKYFEWSMDKSDEYTNLWDDWFLLYDTMHETVVHLVEPVLPRFESLLCSTSLHLDASWWTLLLYRGFNNETSNVQKLIWEYLFARQNTNTLNQLVSQQDFFFGSLLKSLDNTSIYSVNSQGTLVSPFGERLKLFISHIIQNFKDDNAKKKFIRQLIHHLAHVISSHILILYIMESLAETKYIACWGGEELKSLRYLVDRHRHFNTPNRKQFIRKLGIASLIRLANPATLSFSDIAKTSSSLIADYPLSSTSDEYLCLKSWLTQMISGDKSLQTMIENLRERVNTYVCDDMSQDIPIEILRNQANVLARSSLLLSSDDDGKVNPNTVQFLFSALSEKLEDKNTSMATFNRLLVLLDSLWKNIETCFKTSPDVVTLMTWSESLCIHILSRIESQLISANKENYVTDDSLADLLLSVMRLILCDTTVFQDNDMKCDILRKYYGDTMELLCSKNKESTSKSELVKFTRLRLLSTLYHMANKYTLIDFKIDSATIAIISNLNIKRSPDFSRHRPWGDIMSTFIRYKWECLQSIVDYSKMVLIHNPKIETFDPEALYTAGVEQLDSASDLCSEAIIGCITSLLGMTSWEKQPDSVMTCVDSTLAILKEYINSSKSFSVLIRSLMHMVLQPNLLSTPNLNQDDGPLKKAFHSIIELGEWKPLIVGEGALLLHDFWATFTPESNESMLSYVKEIASLLVFGPVRDRNDQRLEASLALKLQYADDLAVAEGTAQMTFNQNDYYVRVLMNDLIIRLDDTNSQHIEFAHQLMGHLMEINDKPELYEAVFNNTPLHRFKIRSWCTILLTSRFIQSDKAGYYMERILGLMQKETNISVRSYMEWTVTRLLLQFPEHLPLIYKQLQIPDAKASYMISVMTVTFFLGEKLPTQQASDYFTKIFPLLAPWMIPNHFNIRLYALCSWERNWNAYKKRELDLGLEKNPYVPAMTGFIQQNGDCKKMADKIKSQYYLARFDPVQDYNIEYIFRENLHVFDILENERIGSKSFVRVNSKPVPTCPFVNPDRNFIYSAADPSELVGHFEDDGTITNTQDNGTAQQDSYQKKIMPWEMMLETDIDLTKALVKEKRRRNDIIVVASLIDRLPNIAGLCRTCEIFNASQLAVHSLKIKDDPSFTTISVSSEKWMPMIEVQVPDLGEYLQKKKDEGYMLCGLEQTTKSAKLGEYEFPEKCVLLLGKEREGIPADLLQLLDQAIEIPQYGVTRSLNVHVSGSLFLYEYTKQIQWRQQSITHQQ